MGWLIQQGRKVPLSNYRKEKLKVLEKYKGLHSHDEKWNRMYERLVAYYDVNHHFVVSRKEDSQEQRSQAKNKTLKQRRQEKLDAIDFPFIIYKSNENLGLTINQQSKWNDMYTQLLSFQKLFGHCKVPLNYNPALGRWVRKQRHEYVTGVLDDKRRVRLEQIDFSWVARQKKKWSLQEKFHLPLSSQVNPEK
jgi:Helicase associated domain